MYSDVYSYLRSIYIYKYMVGCDQADIFLSVAGRKYTKLQPGI